MFNLLVCVLGLRVALACVRFAAREVHQFFDSMLDLFCVSDPRVVSEL